MMVWVCSFCFEALSLVTFRRTSSSQFHFIWNPGSHSYLSCIFYYSQYVQGLGVSTVQQVSVSFVLSLCISLGEGFLLGASHLNLLRQLRQEWMH